MTARDDIVIEARSWIGTPYRHQAATKGAGTDCLGLIRGVWRAVLGREPERVPPYTADWSEPSGREDLLAAGARWMRAKPVEAALPGDVLLFRMREGAVAKHLGIMANGRPLASFIHAYSGHSVVESPLSDPWARRIAACFAFPDGV
ncbi:MAG: NlpC/P60 family protein [Paracoccaceae bacterium]